MGGAIVGRIGGSGLNSSSVFLRLLSACCEVTPLFGTAERAFDSSSRALFGGFAGFGGGRLGGCTLFIRDGALAGPWSTLLGGACLS